tara:strand:+ start:923 stop:1072 length:150 start_codon:yes stop_codon:yes gene_type:complete
MAVIQILAVGYICNNLKAILDRCAPDRGVALPRATLPRARLIKRLKRQK